MRWKVSLFTACAPWVSLDLLAPICAKAGLQGLDLAVKEQAFDPAKPINYWGNNAAGVNLANLETDLPQIQNILATTGLACPVLCSYLQASEVEKIRRLAQAAKTLGVPMVRIGIPGPRPGQVRTQVEETRAQWQVLAAIAAEYGIRFVLELHDRTITSSPSGALRILDGINPAHVGVILDIGNMAIEGNEPLAMSIELLGPYLAHVHVKDLIFQESQNWNGVQHRFVPLGEGCIRWTECLKLLAAANYQGWLVLENFSRLERGPERIAEDLAWLHARMNEV